MRYLLYIDETHLNMPCGAGGEEIKQMGMVHPARVLSLEDI
ncbi:hypothetical protein ACFLQ0_00565 [Nitrospinota bacterium]